MPDNIDYLQIEISADAKKADDALEKLSKSISTLSSSLGGLQTSKLYQLADGMSKFASSMANINGAVKAQDFTRIASGLNKISSINASGIRAASVAMQGLSKSLNNMSFISLIHRALQTWQMPWHSWDERLLHRQLQISQNLRLLYLNL